MLKYLFSPIEINRLEIKNRIAYPSLGLLYSYDNMHEWSARWPTLRRAGFFPCVGQATVPA
ncbi:MAG: hypothetical protein ACLFNS_14055 [Desulfobacterales bacterium]